MKEFQTLERNILTGDSPATETETRSLLDAGFDPERLLREGVMPVLRVVGERFSTGEAFIREILIASRTSQAAIEVLKPHLVETASVPAGKVAIGTVKGDLHSLGKNIVILMLQSAGFEVLDVGVDVAPDAFVKVVRDHQPGILGLSCLLSTTREAVGRTIEALEEAGLRERVKVMVGGAPMDESYARFAGADSYGADAYSAVRIARTMLKP
jgi:5-methyltetrahydrofolate--homocysteine methyltransferase